MEDDHHPGFSLPAVFREIFEPGLLQELSSCPVVELSPNEFLLHDGDFIRNIPLLAKGLIKVRKADESGKEILLYHISPGESCVLSITASLNDSNSRAEAITESPSTVILIRAEKLKDWTERYRTWRKFVMKLYFQRLEELLALVDSIAFKNIDIRLIEKLREKTDPLSNEINTTHQQLANELGTAREVVSRLLKQLEKENKIMIHRGKLKIIKPL
jgi:CRP/FNR family transcriptional regulator